jgi:primosomal protein N''
LPAATESDRIRQDLGIAESQLRDYQARLGKSFLHDVYLSQLTSFRDQLKAGLSATAQAQGDDAKPSVSELAERIKSLKAAHSIEASPQRVRQNQFSAEEPVTARIRRRTEALHASDPSIESDRAASGAQAFPAHEAAGQDSIEPKMTFRERIARDRRRQNREPSVP